MPVVAGGGAEAAPSVSALASAGAPAGAIPGQSPSALTKSSAVTGLFGVKGGVSIETLVIDNRPARENQSASFDRRSDVLPQPVTSGAKSSSASSDVR